MRKFAVLVDAGFVKRKLGSKEDPVTSGRLNAFFDLVRAHSALSSMTLHRIYIYDAPPLTISIKKPLHGGQINFGESGLAKLNSGLHSELAKSPFVAMRYGELQFRGWRLKKGSLPVTKKSVEITADDIEPNIQQKAVDMRIGLDIASLTLKNRIDVIVLVTGDADFIPAMKFARREGAQLYLVKLDHSVRDELREHSDLDLLFDLDAFKASPAFNGKS